MALNPVRAGLAADPLAWPWSTHRDVMGAVICPWVPIGRVASVLARSEADFPSSWHRYVSSDPSVHVAGSREPLSASATRLSQVPLAWIADAAASATRGVAADIKRPSSTRDLFLCLAWTVGWDWPDRLAAVCGITPRGVRKSVRRIDARRVEVGLLCLDDARLRTPSTLARSEKRNSDGTSHGYRSAEFRF